MGAAFGTILLISAIVIAVIFILIFIVKSRNEHDGTATSEETVSEFEKLMDEKVQELSANDTEVKVHYYGKKTALFVQKNNPTLFVLNKKMEFNQYDISNADFFMYINDIRLFSKDIKNGNTWSVSQTISKLASFPVMGKYSKENAVTPLTELFEFAGSPAVPFQGTKMIDFENGRIYINFRQGLLNVNLSDTIYDIASSVEYFDWMVGQEQHHIITKKGRSGAGGAILGGVTFGVVGAVAGGLSRRKADEYYEGESYIDEAFVDLSINGELIRFPFVSKPTEKYDQQVAALYEFVQTLDKLIPETSDQEVTQPTSGNDYASRIQVLTDLYNQGLISAPEFESRKSDILNSI